MNHRTTGYLKEKKQVSVGDETDKEGKTVRIKGELNGNLSVRTVPVVIFASLL